MCCWRMTEQKQKKCHRFFFSFLKTISLNQWQCYERIITSTHQDYLEKKNKRFWRRIKSFSSFLFIFPVTFGVSFESLFSHSLSRHLTSTCFFFVRRMSSWLGPFWCKLKTVCDGRRTNGFSIRLRIILVRLTKKKQQKEKSWQNTTITMR